jgi:hypothetical protein
MCCTVVEVLGVKQHSADKPMRVLVLLLPNPRSSTLRAIVDLLSKVEEIGQDYYVLVLVGDSMNPFRHQHIHPHVVADIHCSRICRTPFRRGEQPTVPFHCYYVGEFVG